MDPMKIEQNKYNAIKRQLIEAYDLDEGDDVLLDTLEGETNLHEMLVNAAVAAKADLVLASATKEMAAAFSKRAKRLEHRSQKLKDTILSIMVDTGLQKIPGVLTLSVSNGRKKVIINDEDEIPEKFISTKTSVNKMDIKAALDDGDEVPGACLSNGEPVLRITV